jgi:hypothetical protein
VNSDYVQDYLSARAFARGDSIYTATPEGPDDAGARVPSHPTPYVNDHPPPYILALAPLAGLRYDQAYTILSLVTLAAAAGIGVVVGRELGIGTGGTLLLTAAVLNHPGVGMCLWTGNLAVTIGFLVVAGWALLRNRRDPAAGAVLGLATALKLYPGLVVFGLLADRRWKAFAAFTAVVVGCWVIAAAVSGPQECVRYVTERAAHNTRSYAGHAFNLSVTGVAHRLFGEPNPNSPWLERVAVRPDVAAAAGTVGSAAVLLAVLVRLATWRPEDRTADRQFALVIPGMLLISPLTWLPTVPTVVPALAVAIRDALAERRWGRLVAVLGCGVLICVDDRAVATRLLEFLGGTSLPWQANLLMLAPTWGIAGLFVVALLPRRPLL